MTDQEHHPEITAHEHEPQAAISNQALVDRINRSDRWMIALTAVIAAGGIISAIIFGWQLSVMQGQLNEMEVEGRPWIGMDVVQSDVVVDAGKAFKISVFIKNFGHSPAPLVKGCVGSDTPNINQQDKAGLANMMKELTGCSEPAETVLMPSGEYAFDVSRKPELITPTVALDINRGFATFAAFGRIDYRDTRGTKYWTTFCALYIQEIKKFNACAYGNEAH